LIKTISLADYLKNDGSTDNTTAFNGLLNDTKEYDKTIFEVPAGTYCFNTIYLHSNITFNFADGAVFKSAGNWGVIHYPSPSTGYGGGIQNIVWNNANFAGYHSNLCNGAEDAMVHSLLHAKNIIFNQCTWSACQHVGGHCIDLGGCSNVLVWQCKFIGYGNSLTDHGGNGNINSEAIQCDYAYSGGMSYKYSADANSYDDLPTHHVYVIGCEFVPFYDGDVIKQYAPCPVGQHIRKDQPDMIHDIYIIGNSIVDAYPQTVAKYYFATIHFPSEVQNIVVANNVFKRIVAPASLYVIGLLGAVKKDNTSAAGNTLIVVNNQYINCSPQLAYNSVSAELGFDYVLTLSNTNDDLSIVGGITNSVHVSADGALEYQIECPANWPAIFLPVFFNTNYLLFLYEVARLSSDKTLQLFDLNLTYTPSLGVFDDLVLDLNRQGYQAIIAGYQYFQKTLNSMANGFDQIGLDVTASLLWLPSDLTLNISGLNTNSKQVNEFFKEIEGGLNNGSTTVGPE
jgi:hypothetical protein